MSNLSKVLSQVTENSSLKATLHSATTFSDLQKAAKQVGLSVDASELASLFNSHAAAIRANVAGVDGNGALVFGRDWAYPGPDTDGRSVE